ncbi:MAG TPA: hypothetical protein VEF89_20280 [Solirubrobacteraceae bacterium]|nr:hypothetical protein [Solirubrobacteraceae bacterium]
MRGEPQAASARLPAVAPARTWSTRLEQIKERRRRRREEELEVIARLQAQERHARRTGEYVPRVRRIL